MLERLVQGPGLGLLNRMLEDQPRLRAELARHAGKQFSLSVGGLSLCAAIGDVGALEAGQTARPSDVEVSLPVAALSQLLEGREALQAQARISGDAALAELLPRLAESLRPDVGAWLSPVLGDIVANRVEQGFAALAALGRRGFDGLSANIGEYLREEGALAVSTSEGEAHRDALARLQADLAKAEARVAQLEGRRAH